MGLTVGLMVAIAISAQDLRAVVGVAGGVGAALGVLAAIFGDRFWYRFGRWLWIFGYGSRRRPP